MTREHWMQVVALVVAVILASVPGIWFLARDIDAARYDAMTQLAALTARVSADEERLTAMEKIEAGHYTDEVAFRAEMRSAINNMIAALADVRIAVSSRNHGAK